MKTVCSLLALAALFTFFSPALEAVLHPDGFTKLEECSNSKLLMPDNTFSQFVITLDNGVVVNEGAIVTKEGKILLDTETYQQDQSRLLRPNRNIAEEAPSYFNGRLAVISSPGQENWYHWLLQVLPRLKVLKESKIAFDKIYINNLVFPWQIKSLKRVMKLLDIPADRLLLKKGDSVTEAKKLIVPSVPHIPSKGKSFPVWLKPFLYKCFLTNHLPKNTYKKIYISRAGASIRRIKNEKKLIQFLRSEGFHIIRLEVLSPYRQAQLFHNAELIMGPHGSGFANLIFAKPTTRVVEIDHALKGKEQRSYYKAMTHAMGCSYFPFYTDTVKEKELESDLYVDIGRFKQFLKELSR